jgi:hypothetical protein
VNKLGCEVARRAPQYAVERRSWPFRVDNEFALLARVQSLRKLGISVKTTAPGSTVVLTGPSGGRTTTSLEPLIQGGVPQPCPPLRRVTCTGVLVP